MAIPAPAICERGERRRLSAIALVVLALHGVVAMSLYHRGFDPADVTVPHRVPIVIHLMPVTDISPAKASSPMTAISAPKRTAHRREDAAKHSVAHVDAVDRHAALDRTVQPKRESAPRRPSSEPTRMQSEQATPTERAAQPVSSTPTASSVTQGRGEDGQQAHPSAQRQAHDADTAPLFDAAYLHNPAPDYPPMALQRGWEGRVLLNVHVLASGSAREVTVVASSGHESLDDAARQAVADWRFVPARRAGQAVDAWVHVPVIFKAA
ncbi:energy transducer TonB [Trinickia sp. NRRL B-1857]|uniref:energy transducer TonB n=1 Tax=Trinickia sp. NRRL B-1857 TaxID=3162879 RepID=UPI003D2B265F